MTTATTTHDDVIVIEHTVIDHAIAALVDDVLWYQTEAGIHRELHVTDWRTVLSAARSNLHDDPDYIRRTAQARWVPHGVPATCFQHDWLKDAVLDTLRDRASQ